MGIRVLVVDDSMTVRQQVSSTLMAAGFEVVEAVDGLDAATKIESMAGLGMVLCDVNMPRMNGIEMLERVKANPSCAGVPIVMLTTEGRPELIAKAKALGAKGWLVKPCAPDALVATVRKLTAAT